MDFFKHLDKLAELDPAKLTSALEEFPTEPARPVISGVARG